MIAVLGVLGPGLVSGFADNDAGGITTYSLAGAKFGYALLWVILASQVVLFFTQEVGARLGLATGKGLMGLIRRAVQRALGRLRGAADARRQPRLDGRGVRGHRRRAGPVRRARPAERGAGRRHRGRRSSPRAASGGCSTCSWPSASSCRPAYVISAIMAKPDWGQALHDLVDPPAVVVARVLAGRRGHGGHHHHALGPGVHPVVHGRQAAATGGPAGEPHRRLLRRAADQRHRGVHPHRLRGDAVPDGQPTITDAAGAAQALEPLAGDGRHGAVRGGPARARRSWASGSCP